MLTFAFDKLSEMVKARIEPRKTKLKARVMYHQDSRDLPTRELLD